MIALDKVGDSLREMGVVFGDFENKSEILGGFSKYVREYGTHRPLRWYHQSAIAVLGCRYG